MAKKVATSVAKKGDERFEDIVTKPGVVVNKFASSEHGKTIGAWAFMAGFFIALIAGFLAGLSATGLMDVQGLDSLIIGVLVLIGLIVGIVNISTKESSNFLIAAIALVVTPIGFSALSNVSMGVGALAVGLNVVADFLAAMTGAIAIFVAPAALIVALKQIYSTARGA